MSSQISLALSSDSDDVVMAYAIMHKLIDLKGYEFQVISDDIQVLNEKACDGRPYDVTAVSAAAFAAARDYELMPVGASMGFSWGPALVVSADSHVTHREQLAGVRIAVPGSLTSAYCTARMVLSDFEAVFMSFDHIADAVVSGHVDAGILIHEAQLAVPDQLRSIGSLHDLWHQYIACQLPLPLGVIVMRSQLSSAVKRDLIHIYKDSIDYACIHTQDILSKVSSEISTGLSSSQADLYIQHYVNASATGYTDQMRQGLKVWFQKGLEYGLWSSLPNTSLI